VEFFVSQWKNAENRRKIGQKPFYVTSRSDVYKIDDTVVERVLELQSNQEEADTRMLLHAKHASLTYPKVLISSPDTDVFIICLSVHTTIAAQLYFLRGVKSKVADYIFDTLKRCDVSKEVLMQSLVGFHSFTGCDTISAFAGRGKVKPLKLMLNDSSYVHAFSQLGNQTQIVDLLKIKSFVCHMYGYKGDFSVDELRYNCTDALELHMMRANYQARIWKESLLQFHSNLDLLENGWTLDEDGGFSIKWMRCNPAPDEVLLKLWFLRNQNFLFKLISITLLEEQRFSFVIN